MPAKKILLIEDDWNFQSMMTVLLCENGFEVETADNGAVGMKKALTCRPDLILLDYNLGDMNGAEAAFWLTHMTRTRSIPVILLSAMAGDPKVADEFKKLPACRCVIPKTLSLPEILKHVRAAVNL